MKYLKILSVNTRRMPIVSDSWSLEIDSPGRGIVSVLSDDMLEGTITLDLGIVGANKKCERWFSGYIEQCLRIDKRQVRLMVREMGAVLAARWPMALRNATAADVLAELSRQTGLVFNLENAGWVSDSIPHFINLSSGYEAMDLLGKHLNIPRYRWQCQPDGSIYVGGAAGTAAHRKLVRMPANIFTETSVAGATCALLPALRPGQRISIGDGGELEISNINVSGEKMRLGWA